MNNKERDEKFLKSWLKKKISITTSTVVSFLITGAVGGGTAYGVNANGTGGANAVAIGTGSTTTGDGIAIGKNSTTGGPSSSISLGVGATSKYGGIAIGEDATAQGKSIVIGSGIRAPGSGTVVIGDEAGVGSASGKNAKGENSIAIGKGAGKNSDANTFLFNTITIGAHSKVGETGKARLSQSIAIGGVADREADRGGGTWAKGDQSIAIGGDVKSLGDSSVAIGGDDLDAVSSANSTYSDKKFDKNGNQISGGDKTANLNSIFNTITGRGAILAGGTGTDGQTYDRYNGTKSGQGAVALGVKSQSGDIALAIGTFSEAKGTNSVAIGTGAQTPQSGAVAIGGGSTTYGLQGRQITDADITLTDGTTMALTNFAGASGVLEGSMVSFGKAGNERQLKHIAPGEVSATSTDGINGSQLFAVAKKLGDDISKFKYVSIKSNDAGNKLNDGATANNAIAIGPNASTKVESAVSLGDGANVLPGPTKDKAGTLLQTVISSGSGVAIGKNATATQAGVAIGDTSSTVTSGIAIGREAKVTNKYEAASGPYVVGDSQDGYLNYDRVQNPDNLQYSKTEATGNNIFSPDRYNGQGIAIGYKAESNMFGTSLGNSAVAKQGGLALGTFSRAEGATATAIGLGANSSGARGISMGRQASATTADSVAIGTGARGGATSAGGSVAIGGGAAATGTQAIAIGGLYGNDLYSSSATKDGAGNLTKNTQASGAGSIAMGVNAVADKDNALALGGSTQVFKNEDVALGYGSKVTSAPTSVTSATVGGVTYGGFAGTNPSSSLSIGSVGNERQIKNVAAGEISATSTDAINGSQLYSVANKLSQGWTATADGNKIGTATPTAVKPGNTVVYSAGSNLQVKQTIDATNGKQTYEYSLNKDLTGLDSVTTKTITVPGATPGTNDVVIGKDGINAGSKPITNVAPGVNGTDAVNKNQLDQKIGDNTIKLGGDKGTTGTQNLSQGGGLQFNIKGGDGLETSASGTDVTVQLDTVTKQKLNKAVLPLKFSGDDYDPFDEVSTVVSKELGQKLEIVGGADTTDPTKLSNNNIGTMVDGTGKVNIKLAKELKDLTSAEFKTPAGDKTVINGDGLTVTPVAPGAAPISVTKDGISAGDKKVTNVAPGTISSTSTDAINGSQFHGLAKNTIQLGGDNATTTNIQTLDKTGGIKFDIVGANGITTEAKDGKVTVSVDASKISASNSKLSYTANGDTPKQEVKLSDGLNFIDGNLTTASVAANGVVKYDVKTSALTSTPDGKVTVPTTDGVATAKDVANAINNSGWQANADATGTGIKTGTPSAQLVKNGSTVSYVAGNNLTVAQDVDANGNHKYTYSLNKDLKDLDSVTSKTITVPGATPGTNDVVIGKDGISAGNKVIKDVAPGVNGTDAVNKNQLDTTANDLINKGMNFSADDYDPATANTTVSKKLGERLEIVGGADKTKLSDNNIGSVVDNTGKINVKLAKELKDLTSAEFKTPAGDKTVINGDGLTVTPVAPGAAPISVTKDGINAGNKTITNVAPGVNGTDAVNKNQLDQKIGDNTIKLGGDNATVTAGQNLSQNGGLQFNIKGANGIETSASGTDVTVKLDAATKGKIDNAADKNLSNLTPTGIDKIKDTAAWKVKANNNTAETVKGGDEVVFKDGAGVKITQSGKEFTISADTSKISQGTKLSYTANGDAPKQEVTLADGLNFKNGNFTTATVGANGEVKYDTVTQGLTVTDGKAGLPNPATPGATTPNGLVTAQDVADALNSVGWKATADATGTGIKTGTPSAQLVKNGSTVSYVAGNNLTVAQDVDANGNHKYTYSLNKDLKDLDSVTTKTITIPGATPGTNDVVIGKDGISAGNKVIKDVAPGVNGTDAVNKNQLDTATNDLINKGMNFSADDYDPATANTTVSKKLGERLEIVGGADKTKLSDNNIGSVVDNTGKINVKLAKELKDLTSAEFKTPAGDKTVINGDGLTVTPVAPGAAPISVTKDGINAGNKTITNVAPGVNGTDAVNKNQLDQKIGDNTIKLGGDNATVTAGQNLSQNGGLQFNIKGANGIETSASGTDVTVKLDAATKGKIDNAADKNLSNLTPAGIDKIKDTAAWKVKANNNTAETVKGGDEVVFKDGAGVTITQSGKEFTISADTSKISQGTKLSYTANGDAPKQEVTLADGLNFKNGNFTTASVGANGEVKYDTVTQGLTVTDGKASLPNPATPGATTPNGLVTAQDVADALNNVGWKATADATGTGEKTGTPSAQLVKNGSTVSYIAGDNLTVAQDVTAGDHKYTYSLNKVLKDLTSAEFKTPAGDKTVINGDGLTVSPATPTTSPISVTKDGISAGDKKITNVAPGTISKTSTDAINGSQLYNLASNTIQLGGDNATTTATQQLDKAGGIKFDIVGANGITTEAKDGKVTVKVDSSTIGTNSKLKYTANGDAPKQEVTLADGLNFKNGNFTTATVGANGEVKYDTVTQSLNVSPDGKAGLPNPATPGATTPNGLVTAQDVANALNNVGWNATADATGTGIKTGTPSAKLVKNGSTVSYVAGNNLTVAQDVDANGNHKYTYSLNKDLKDLDSVTTKTITIPGATPGTNDVVIGKDGISAGNKVIKDVAPGVNGTDAVNKNQLDTATNDLINKGMNFSADDYDPATANTTISKKLGERLEIVGGADKTKLSDNNIGSVVDNTGKINVKLAKELKDLTSAEFKTPAGDKTVINGDGLTVSPATPTTSPISVTKDGISAGDKKVTNVAPGTISKTSTDAINGSQLYNLASNTIQLGGDKATTTDKQTLDKTGGIKFDIVGANGITTEAKDGKVTVSVDTSTIGANTKLKYKSNSDAATAQEVKLSDGLDFKNGNFTTASVGANGEVKYDTVTQGLTVTDGKAGLPNPATPGATTPNGLVTAQDVADALNNVGWKATADATGTGIKTGTPSAQLVKNGSTVSYVAGDNLTVAQDVTAGDHKYTYSLNKVLKDLTSAEFKTAAGDKTVINGDGLTVNPATPTTSPISITKDGISAGDKVVKNVAPGTISSTSTDAINGSQFHKLATNTIQLGGDNATTTATQQLDKAGGIKFDIVGANGITTEAKDGKVTVKVDAATIGANTKLKYKSNSDAATSQEVKLADGLDFKNGNFTTASVGANGEVKYDTVTQGLAVGPDGKASLPNPATPGATTPNGLVTAQDVADALNSVGWKATADATGTGIKTGTPSAQLVKNGSTVSYVAGDNLTVAQDVTAGDHKYTYSLNKVLKDLTSAEFKTPVGDKTVINGDGLTVNPATPGTAPISITKDGISAGDKVVKNVAPGTISSTSTDAINGSQFHKLATNTIQLGGDNATTTATQQLDKAGGIKFNIVGENGITTKATGDKVSIGVDTSTIGANIKLKYKSNSDAATTQEVKLSDGLDFKNGNFTTATVGANGEVKYDTVTQGLSVSPDGKAGLPNPATPGATTPNGLVTAQDVANALNSVGWNATADATGTGVKTGTPSAQLVKNGSTVSYVAGDNLAVEQNVDANGNHKYTYSLNKQLKDLTSAEFVNPTSGNKTVVNGDGLTITPSTPGAKNISITKDGISAGDKKITDVADGDITPTSKDAINGSQLYKLASNTISLGGDNSTVTATQQLNKNGGIKFNIVGDNGIITEAKDDKVIVRVNPSTIGSNITLKYAANGANDQTVKLSDGLNFQDGNFTKASVDAQGKVKYDTVTQAIAPTADGKAQVAPGSTPGLATSADVVNAINNSGWKATAGGNVTGTATPTLVKNGQEVEFNAGDNLKVKQTIDPTTGKQTYEYSLNKDLTGLNSAEFTNAAGDKTKITAGNTEYTNAAGDKTVVNADGLTISSSTPGAKDISVTKDGISAGDKVIKNVAAGVNDTDAVNVSQLKDVDNKITNVNNTINKGLNFKGNTGATVNKQLGDTLEIVGEGTKADSEYSGQNLKVVEDNGKLVVKMDKNLKSDTVTADTVNTNSVTVGAPGKDGVITVKDANGKDGVSINGKDGSIGLNGKDGSSATISTVQGNPGVNGTPGTTMDRIQYTDNSGTPHQVATLDDGMKYGGDTGAVINKKLNQQVNVVGGITDVTKLAANDNIGVVSDGSNNLKVRLAKDLDGLETVTVRDASGNTTVVKGDGVTITSPSGNTVSLSNQGLDNGGNVITNVAAGKDGTDAVNVDQLNQTVGNVVNAAGDAIAHVNNKVDKLGDRVNKGLAGAAAMAGLEFMDIGINQATVAAAVGGYRGTHAVAVGVQAAPTENTRINAKVSMTPGSRSETMYSVGASYRFNWR
ncbi:YadA-like family protein [Fusobacterium pseudoperiodonticum]|nr:YadA-like family protein [Fusobacterium pseudoperiodonticum]